MHVWQVGSKISQGGMLYPERMIQAWGGHGARNDHQNKSRSRWK
jgi:hypothetical protein